MAKEIGKVTLIENGVIEVKVPTGRGCALCGGKLACTFSGPDSAYRNFRLPFQSGIQEGDRVTLKIRESAQTISAFIIFGSPILIFLVGYLFINSYLRIPNSEIWTVLATLILYSITLFLSNRWLSRSAMFQPRIISVESIANKSVPENTIGQNH